MDVEIEIGSVAVDRVLDKDDSCYLFNKKIDIIATEDDRKKVSAIFIIMDEWEPETEGAFEGPVGDGMMYRITKVVKEKTKMGTVFGDDYYSPDKSDELLCVVSFVITVTNENVSPLFDETKDEEPPHAADVEEEKKEDDQPAEEPGREESPAAEEEKTEEAPAVEDSPAEDDEPIKTEEELNKMTPTQLRKYAKEIGVKGIRKNWKKPTIIKKILES